ncbi:SDR family NAD(P)-dependent oxidoreductase [Roseomonas sp. AR75]|uniref:SDR family NAD(P)-dependent oxidoreductase n=1 Tax=Roseomonas sp. AR75 TaxID=2562311 RepID=UPI0010C0A1DB|nr:SDR family oxidoreductase [Roseomonas sp. AR75]
MSVQGKVALVTGGASGIGRAAAIALARHGAEVVVFDRNAEGAGAVAAEAGCTAMVGDIGESADVTRVVDQTIAGHGRIDILLHAAGIFPRNPYFEMTDEQWRHVLRVNLDGSFFVTREVGRHMRDRGAGTMILMTSDRGIHGAADFAHYAAAKGGMLAMVKSLALALGRHGVTVNGINPGMTDTPLARGGNPNWEEKLAVDVLGSCSTPEDVAEIVLFLAGTAGRFMTGQIVSTRLRYGA